MLTENKLTSGLQASPIFLSRVLAECSCLALSRRRWGQLFALALTRELRPRLIDLDSRRADIRGLGSAELFALRGFAPLPRSLPLAYETMP